MSDFMTDFMTSLRTSTSREVSEKEPAALEILRVSPVGDGEERVLKLVSLDLLAK